MSSITRSLQKAYWRLTTYKPSSFLMGIIAIAAAIFFLGGGIYDVISQSTIPIAIFTQSGGQGGFLFLYPYPDLNSQFIAESMFIMILYALGFMGFYLTYQSTKYAYNTRQAYLMLIAGLMFVLVAYALLEYIFYLRQH